MIKELVHVWDNVTARFRGTGGMQVVSSPPKLCGPRIRGFVTTRLRDAQGRVIRESKGENIWTLYGREYLAHQISWHAYPGADRTTATPAGEDGVVGVPNPGVLYIGVGVGEGRLELASTSQLYTPTPYAEGLYLKRISLPAEYPSNGAVRYTTEFLKNEISLPDPVDITEFGLFLDSADPTEQYNPPVAYKVMEPQTKTLAVALEVEWEVRFE